MMRSVLAFVVLLLFVVTATATFYVYHLRYSLLDADVYKEGLRQSGFYEKVYLFAAPVVKTQAAQLSSGSAGKTVRTMLAAVKDADIAQFLRAAAPPEFVQWQTERAVDGMLAWFNSTQPNLGVSLDLKVVAQRLPGAVRPLAGTVVSGIPECAAGQSLENFPDCRLAAAEPNMLQQAAIRQLTPALNDVAQTLSQPIDLGSALQQNPRTLDPLRALRQQTSSIVALLLPLASGAAVLLLVLVLLAARSPRSLAGWLGTALLLTGVLALLPVLLAPGLVAGSVRLALAPAGLPPDVLASLPSVVGDMVSAATRSMQLQAAGIAAGGLVLIVIAVLLGLRRPSALPAK